MASSDFLRKNKNQHSIKNSISKRMDNDINLAIEILVDKLKKKYPKLSFHHEKKLMLKDLIKSLSKDFYTFKNHFSLVMDTSFIKPDGGFLYAEDKKGRQHLILVAEVKRQGTNDRRAAEGKRKQAKGNAIERLGKNLIGIRAIFKKQNIVPFVCFGSGYDFIAGSSILDRVVTMNDFFPLNNYFVTKEHKPFEPVTMFFRYEDWSTDDMVTIMEKVARISIKHYFF